MTVPTLVFGEIRRLVATPLARLAFAALMLVPLIYGGLYLWANRDPYGALNRVPAALVVADTGATSDGSPVNYGDQIADQVIDSADFKWTRTSAEDAATGVRNGDYDFSITLPADFSTDLVSASTDSPTQARITLTTNDTNGYLASTIAGQAAERIRTSIAEQVGQEAADKFLVGIATIRTDLANAADGATQVASGADQAKSGSSQLRTGASQLADGASSLSAGLDQLQSATSTLPDDTARLAAGARQVADGNAKLAQGGAEAVKISGQAAAAVPTVRADIITALQQAQVPQADIDAVLAKLDPLGQAVTDADAKVQAVDGQLNQLAAGSAQVADGAGALSSASGSLTAGIASAASGASQLSDGAATASNGAAQLDDGLGTLSTGAAQLRDGLNSGVASIPNPSDQLKSQQAATIGSPVDLATTDDAQATNYGAGLAPFFLSLAAWIGLYALFLIVKPLSRRAITALASPAKVTLAAWLTPGLLGVVQSIMLVTLAGTVLGFGIANPAGMFVFGALISLTFAAILLALNALLGSVGQFLGLVLMVVQLVTAGGTFPWQTLPEPLAAIHRFLPMSYAVDGYRHLMYGGEPSAVLLDAAVLAGWLLAGVLATYLTTARMTRFRTLRDLRPSLIG